MSHIPPIFCLMGPTASGKTALAVSLVQQFPLEIISVDSAMIYRGMDIGTAKPDKNILKQAPHHLIDICDPNQSYSAAQFCNQVLELVSGIQTRGNIPLLVGGTMMYFRALRDGLAVLPSADENVREKINKRAEKVGWQVLHDYLATVDPQSASRIHKNDAQRIQRALEVYELTGLNLTVWQKKNENIFKDFNLIYFAIMPHDRAILHERIQKRFLQMLDEGLVAEVLALMQRGDLTLSMPSMRSVGYRQVWEYLQDNDTLPSLIEKGTAATRQLAKRQLTWLRSWPYLTVFDSEDPLLLSKVAQFIQCFFC